MYIKINGEDRIDDIHNYSYDFKNNTVKIRFIGSKKVYSYPYNIIEIGPVNERKIKDDELIIYKDNYLKNIKTVYDIGDGLHASTKIITNNGEKFYKTVNLKFEVLKEYALIKDEIIIIKNEIKTVKRIEFSANFARVEFINNNQLYLYRKNEITVDKHMNFDFEKMMNYYTEIAKIKDICIKDEVENYLENQINNIYIKKNSALYAFLSKKSKNKKHHFKQTIYPFGINLSQRNAIKNIETNQLSIIQGPPGTGKTRSILNILANLIINDKTATVVSSNNEAIKNVKEKMEEEGYGFLVALLGKSENKELFFKKQPNYPIQLTQLKKSADEMESILLDIQIHEDNVIILLKKQNELANIKQLISEYVHEYNFFVEYLQKSNVEKLKQFHFFKLSNNKILELLVELNYQKNQAINIIEKMKYIFKYGIYDFKQFNNLDSIIIDMQDRYYQQKIKDLEKERDEIEKCLKTKNFNTEMKLLIDNSKEYFQSYLANRFTSNVRSNFSINNYFCYENFIEFVKEYPVILSTTHAIAKSKNKSYKFDFLIVDEASQVELVPGIIALDTAENAVIVGDLKQLPHIPESRIKKEQFDYWHNIYNISDAYNYQKHSLLSSFNIAFKDKIANELLVEHYRCHSKIISFCNKKYYDNLLICHSRISSEKPLVLLKTVKGNHARFCNRAVNKITNIRELDSLNDKEFLENAGITFECKKSFGFIAPFRGQANVAHEILPSEFQKDTVHKFQGRECDIVMFSSVLDRKNASKKLLPFVDEPSLINVAVSRAKEKFILVSDVEVFKEAKGEINDLIRYMEYYEEDSVLYESNVRSVFDLLYSDYANELERKKSNSQWKKSNFDSENLTRELIENILFEEKYNKYKFKSELKLKELFRNLEMLDEDEKKYIQNNARVDFVIYNKFDNQVVLAIEVDGTHFHENNPKQLVKDKVKDQIFSKYHIPLLRLKTNHSDENKLIRFYL